MNRNRTTRQSSSLKKNVLGLLLCALLFFSFTLFLLVGNKAEIEENNTTIEQQQILGIVQRNIEEGGVNEKSLKECKEEVITVSWKPRIFLYKNFLTPEQCDYLLNKGKDLIVRSTVVGAGKDEVSDHRTSSGVFLDTEGDPAIIEIEKKIASWVSIPPIHYESFYLLRYQVGEQYKPHYDYFDEITAQKYIGEGGQRTATVILGLQQAEEGGATSFPKVNITVEVERGDALLFYNRHTNGSVDPLTLHAGEPVIQGEKWVITKWIRERPYPVNWWSREKSRPKPNPNAINPFTGEPEFGGR